MIRRGSTSTAAVVLAGLLAACEAPAPDRPAAAVVTLATLQAAYQAGADVPFGVGLSRVFPGGFPPSYFLSSASQIRVAPAYTSGEQTAYMTTDVWVNFPVVWVQPLYVFVSEWNADEPTAHILDLPWVFTVGTESAFWSPFHRVTYVEVPPETPVDRYRSVRAILGAGLPLHAGPTRLITVAPDGMGPEEVGRFLLPKLRAPGKIALPQLRRGWSDQDGREISALDFGENRFQYNERDEVVEQPLFFFFGRDEAGAWFPYTTIPRVGGTGPLFAGQAPLAPGNRPLYGSHWRLYAAHLPPTARVFVPRDRRPEWETRNGGSGLGPPTVEPPAGLVATPAELDEHAFKVLLDEACLSGPALTAGDLARCPWLDSQEAIERHLAHALYPSEILVACPYLSHAGSAVPASAP